LRRFRRGAALDLASRLDPALCRVKVGKELFTSAGPALVETLAERGFEVFLDLKFHDIPHTVAQACKAAARLGVWMVNVHALGGRKMMAAAREALEEGARRPKLIAVTVLTSMGGEDLAEIGLSGEPQDNVLRLANWPNVRPGRRGMLGARPALRAARRVLQVTPGIRPASADRDDQVRIATPAQALRDGASYLVIGRPITQAADPLQALKHIHLELEMGAVA
jgi:orotidine-5'-phosphate decarboxylase